VVTGSERQGLLKLYVPLLQDGANDLFNATTTVQTQLEADAIPTEANLETINEAVRIINCRLGRLRSVLRDACDA